MDSIAINGTLRSGTGKKNAKQARREGLVPCVIYGGKDVVHFTTTPKEVKGVVYTPDFKEVNITVERQAYKCILKDLQFHPVTDELLHIDFLNLVPGNDIKVDIPVRCVGTSPGVVAGGRLSQKLRTVKVKTKPEHLVGELSVDISKLTLGQSVRVRDIELKEGMEMMSSSGIPIATVETPRAMKSAAAAAEEGAGEAGTAAPAAEEA